MSNEELIELIKKNVIAVACVLVSIAIGVAIYLRSDLLPEAEKVLAAKTQDAELLAANIEDNNQLKEQHAALVSADDVIATRMIKVGQLAENLQYFYKIESDTGAKLMDLRQVPWSPPSKNAPKTIWTPVGFALTAQGSYPQLMDMLRRLENGEHYCRVMSCTIHPLTEQRGGNLSMGVNLELLGTE
jgi:hypothetical protein